MAFGLPGRPRQRRDLQSLIDDRQRTEKRPLRSKGLWFARTPAAAKGISNPERPVDRYTKNKLTPATLIIAPMTSRTVTRW